MKTHTLQQRVWNKRGNGFWEGIHRIPPDPWGSVAYYRVGALVMCALVLAARTLGQQVPRHEATREAPPRPVPARFQKLSTPSAVGLDASGELLIADTSNNRIRRVDAAGIISVLAGNGVSRPKGDEGPATRAGLAMPSGVAADRFGNVFIADTGNNRVCRVDAGGTITTVAGTGQAGFSGDDGPAINAMLNGPTGIVVDSEGSLDIADRGNNRIRRVDSAGNITTVAGTGKSEFSGDAGPAVKAGLASPSSVAFDSEGNLYVADTGNNRIRRVDSSGQITTVAGNGGLGFQGDGGPATKATLASPMGLAVDDNGTIYLADALNNRIRRVDATGMITTAAGSSRAGFSGDGGPATEASLSTPSAVALGSGGTFFIADRLNQRIRRVDSSGIITTVAGNGLAGDDVLNQPPVAKAGPEQSVECTSPSLTPVTLDGSGSTDPDNDPLTFTWSGPFAKTTGVRPQVRLPLGRSTVTLVVNDGQADSKPATNTITVIVRPRVMSPALSGLVLEGQPIPVAKNPLEAARGVILKLELLCGTLKLGAGDIAARPQVVALARNGQALDLRALDLNLDRADHRKTSFEFLDGAWIYRLNSGVLGPGSYVITIQMPDGRRFVADFMLK